jgi:hypothetical protein
MEVWNYVSVFHIHSGDWRGVDSETWSPLVVGVVANVDPTVRSRWIMDYAPTSLNGRLGFERDHSMTLVTIYGAVTRGVQRGRKAVD